MVMDWTPKREEEIRERCEKATPPDTNDWSWSEICQEQVIYLAHGILRVSPSVTGYEMPGLLDDREFYAHARTDLPDALAEIQRLKEEIERLKREEERG